LTRENNQRELLKLIARRGARGIWPTEQAFLPEKGKKNSGYTFPTKSSLVPWGFEGKKKGDIGSVCFINRGKTHAREIGGGPKRKKRTIRKTSKGGKTAAQEAKGRQGETPTVLDRTRGARKRQGGGT